MKSDVDLKLREMKLKAMRGVYLFQNIYKYETQGKNRLQSKVDIFSTVNRLLNSTRKKSISKSKFDFLL